MRINRRNLIKLALLSTATFVFSPLKRLLAKETKTTTIKKWPDLVGVKDGSPAQMFEIGIKALGGMKRFVKSGQTVLIKPNIAWNKTPSEGANTNPDLVGIIIKMAYQAGAKRVNVFDHTCNMMKDCYKNSGVEESVKKNKGYILPSDEEKYYQTAKIPGAEILKEALVHKAYIEADVVINVPVLKSHSSTRMTSALKNFMGVVWDRRYWHRKGLHQCIADFSLFKKADLTVIDAYNVMMKNGPMGISTDDLQLKKMQILSTDAVLADAAATKILGLKPKDVRYLSRAVKLGHGSIDLKNKQIKRISCKV